MIFFSFILILLWWYPVLLSASHSYWYS